MKKHAARAYLPAGVVLTSAVVLFIAGAAPLRAATWYAAPGATGSGTSAADPGDLRALVETRAAAGDTVRLSAGTFAIKQGGLYTGINVDRPLVLIGAGRGKTILKCLNTVVALRIEAAAGTASSLAVQSMTFRDGGNYQLDIVKGSPTVENVEFLGNAITATLISRSGHPVIKKCVFKADAPIGLTADTPGAPALVTECLFSMPGKTGLDYVSVDSGNVEHNTFNGNRVGIQIYAAETTNGTKTSASLIRWNTFLKNTWGIALDARFKGVDKCTIKGNTFKNNIRGVTGLGYEGGVEKSTVDSNHFISNTHGLIFSTTRMTVVNNLLTGHKETNIASEGGVNTIAFNTVAGGKADGVKLTAYKTTGDRSLVVNNIFVSNTGFGISLDAASKKARLGGNDIFGNTKGVIDGAYVDLKGNLTVAPLFKAGSYALAAGSPCIDKAIAAYTTDHDITGTKRTKPDIGAYEFME
jgi:hypothetical protein